MDALSNTEHYTPTITLETKGARRIADRALTLVNESNEQNSSILSSAEFVISGFTEVLDDHPKMHFNDAVAETQRRSLPMPGAPVERESVLGADLAGEALKLSAKIEMHESTQSKALMWLNRHIGLRDRATGSMATVSKRRHSNGNGRRDPHRRSAYNGKKRG